MLNSEGIKTIVLLSGPIAVGKSGVATVLTNQFGFVGIRSGPYLREIATRQGEGHSRAELQQLGDALDEKTDFAWLVDDVAAGMLNQSPEQERWLLDSVRKERQVIHFRDRFGTAVLHVHLTAAENVLRARYEARLATGGEYVGNTPYSAAIAHPNEISSRALIRIADYIVELDRTSSEEAALDILKYCKGRARL
jgi:cytidylate kinase